MVQKISNKENARYLFLKHFFLDYFTDAKVTKGITNNLYKELSEHCNKLPRQPLHSSSEVSALQCLLKGISCKTCIICLTLTGKRNAFKELTD